MKYSLLVLSLLSSLAHAETWTVQGKSFESKAMAVRYVVSLGKPVEITHTRCEILTNKLSFKACPKNKVGSFENEQFTDITQTN